jgi:PAS domain S-box-containing protein
MDDLSKKTKDQLIAEIVRLQNFIASGKNYFPGLSVIEKVEKKAFVLDEKFRVLFNFSKEAILLISDGKIIEFNDAALSLFMLSSDELRHAGILQLSLQQQPDGQTKNFWKTIEKETIKSKETKKLDWFFNRGNNSVFHGEVSVSPLWFDDKPHLMVLIRDISSKKDLEKTIRRIDSEQHFVQSGTWTIDLKSHTAQWSESMLKMHLLSARSVPPTLKEYINVFIDKEQKQEFDGLIRRAIKTGKEFTIDLKVNLPNKEVKYFYLQCKTEKENEVKQSKLFGICLDITERKKLEADLKEQKDSYQLLVNNLPDGVIIYTSDRILYANKGAMEIVGSKELTQEEINRHSIYRFLLEKFHPEIDRKINLIYRGKDLGDVEMKLKKTDGSVIDIRVRSNPIVFKGEPCIQAIFSDITQRKIVERHLKESERKLSTLIKNLPGMAYRCLNNKDWTMEFVSDGSLGLTGYTAFEIVSGQPKTYGNMVHQQDQNHVWEAVQQGVKNKHPFVIEYRILRKNGELAWVREQGVPVFSDTGNLEALEGFIADITPQKIAEKEIFDSREKYKNLVDFLPTGIIIHQSGRIIYANMETIKIFRLNSTTEILGKSEMDYVAADFREAVKQRIKASQEGKEQPFFPIKVVAANGEQVHVETKSIPFLFEGSPATLVVIHDLSQEKKLKEESLRAQIAEQTNQRLEEEIHKREKIQQELSHSQSYIKNILNSSLDIIIANDNNGRITEFNIAAQKAFGCKEPEIFSLYNHQLYRDISEFQRVSDSLKKHGVFAGEVRNIDAKGNEFSSYLTAADLFDEKGNVVGVMGVSRDLTMIKEEREKHRASEQGYKAIFNQALIGIAKISLEGNLLQVNQHFSEMLEVAENKLSGEELSRYTHPDDRELLSTYFNNALTNKTNQSFFDKRLISKSKKTIYCNVNLSLVKNDAKKPIYFIVVYSDISEIKKSQEKLLEQKSKLNAILESSTHLVFSFNKEMSLTSFNTNMIKFIHDVYEVKPILGLKMDDKRMITTPENHQLWMSKINEVFKGQSVSFETSFRNRKGESTTWEIFLSPVLMMEGPIQEIAGVGHNISDKKQAEKEMRDQRAKLEAIFETTSNLIYTIDKDFKLTSFNKIYEKQTYKDLGVKPYIGAATDLEVKKSFPTEQYDYYVKAHLSALKGNPQQYDYKILNKNGQRIYYQVFLDPIVLPDKTINEVVYIAHDISEKMSAQFEIYNSLKEKEVLLKEVHHRVKNNLQVISSILNLQRSYISNPETDDVFKEIQNRIKSMSFIHESLYTTQDFAALNFEEYLKNLIQNLQYSYQKEANAVSVEILAESVQLSLDQSIPCGLIINELVSNAFKYAFEGRKKGKLVVTMKEKAKFVELTVVDDGIGFPQKLDFARTDTLGLQLVTSLVEQLDGSIIKQNKLSGTGFLIRFKKNY